jgi:phosphomannomutase
MIEVWKDIVGYVGLYQVSNLGNVKSLDKICGGRKGIVKGKPIATQDNGRGYINVCLNKDGQAKRVYVHRLVAEAFLPKENLKDCVNHKDGNKANNNLDNLEWVTRSENMQHAYSNGLAKQYERSGTKNPAARVVIDIESGVFYETMKEVSELYKISVSYLSSMLNGRMQNKTNFRYV